MLKFLRRIVTGHAGLLLIIALAVSFRLIYLPRANTALFCDAGLYAGESKKILFGLSDPLSFPCKPVLHIWYTALFFALFGATVLSARVATLIMGVLTIIPVYGISKIALRSRWHIIPPLLQAMLWYPVAYSVEPLVDTTLAFFICCAVLFFCLYMKRGRNIYLLLSGISAGLSVDTKETALGLLVLLALFLLLKRKSLLIFLIPVVIAAAPEIIRQNRYGFYTKALMVGSGGISGLTLFRMLPAFFREIIPDIAGRVLDIPLFVLLCSGVIVLLFKVLRKREYLYSPITLICACAVFLSLFLSAGRIYAYGHWLVYAFPFYTIMIGYFFSEASVYFKKYNEKLLFIGVIFVLSLLVIPESLARKKYFPYHSPTHMDDPHREFKARVYNRNLSEAADFIIKKQAEIDDSGDIVSIRPAAVVLEDLWSFLFYSIIKLKSGKTAELKLVYLPQIFAEYKSFQNLEKKFKGFDIYYLFFKKYSPHLNGNMEFYDYFIKRNDLSGFGSCEFGESEVQIFFRKI